MNKDFDQIIIDSIYKSFDYRINNIDYFKAALTHKSNSLGYDYERLEILGDSILQFVITEMIYAKYPKYNEGEITVVRQNLVNSKNLNKIFDKLNINKVVEKVNRKVKGINISSDVFESLIAAMYLDSDLITIKKIIYHIFKTKLSDSWLSKDFKTQLQELMHSKKIPLPKYTTMNSKRKSFKYKVSCVISSLNINECIHANKVKPAEQVLAQIILNKIDEKN